MSHGEIITIKIIKIIIFIEIIFLILNFFKKISNLRIVLIILSNIDQ